MSTLHELLGYGSIVAHDEDTDTLLTVNGAYYNLWAPNGNGEWTNVECYDLESRVNNRTDGSWNGLYGIDMAKVITTADDLLESILHESEDEDE